MTEPHGDPIEPDEVLDAEDLVDPDGEEESAEPAPEGAPAVDESVAEQKPEDSAAQQLAERTADLQRLQAEYVNYKRRVDRDREMVRLAGAESVLRSLLTVLDDVRRADTHGELSGGFKAVADSLQRAVEHHNLETFGAPGEPFDPNQHEAVFHAGTSTEVEVQSVDTVMQVGYRIGERVLRAATVSVVDPAEDEVEAEAVELDDVADDAEQSDR